MDGTLDCVEKVVGMEECESDYSVVHLGPETQGLPAFHRIVGEDEVNLLLFQRQTQRPVCCSIPNFDAIDRRGQGSTAALKRWNQLHLRAFGTLPFPKQSHLHYMRFR